MWYLPEFSLTPKFSFGMANAEICFQALITSREVEIYACVPEVNKVPLEHFF